MNEILQADIFFFITSIAVVVVGIGLSIGLVYIILILRDMREVARKVRKASDGVEEDFDDLRAGIRNEGVRVKTAFDLALSFIARRFGKARRRVKAGVKKKAQSE